MTSLLTAAQAQEIAYTDVPPLQEALLAGFPPILVLMDRLLQSTYTLVPRTLVREEKNKTSAYHGTSTNITVHLERRTLLDTVPLRLNTLLHEYAWTLDGINGELVMALGNNPEHLKLFVQSFAPVASTTQQPGIVPPKPVLINATEYFIYFNALKASTLPFTEGKSALQLSSSDEALYLACQTRFMELSIATVCEFTNNSVQADVTEHNRLAKQRAVYLYTFFLINLVRTYLRPTQVS